MSYFSQDSAILAKTKELCAAIVADSNFKSLHASIENFLSNDEARLQYQSVHEKGQALSQKQQAGLELSPAEITEFETVRDAVFQNQVAVNFMQAQQEIGELQQEISKFTGLTLELGRVPTAEEVAEAGGGDGCCGGGCCDTEECSDEDDSSAESCGTGCGCK